MIGWLLLTAALAAPEAPWPHAGVRWETLQTEHFAVHWPTSTRHPITAEQTAQRLADVVDTLWLRMSDETGFYVRERIHLVVVDHPDDLVGYTLPARDLVVISAHPGPQLHRLRGRSDWLTDAVAHELGHVWTHKAAGALSERVPRIELGGVVDLPGASLGGRIAWTESRPMWWSEGGAEYLSERVGVNWWSAARDMTLRAAVLEDRLLTWAELQQGRVERSQADAERGYQQGYAFVRWLDARFGEGTTDRIGQLASRRTRPSYDRLLRDITGVPAAELYDAHVAELTATYEEQRQQRIDAGLATGREVRGGTAPWDAPDLRTVDRFEAQPRPSRERERERTGAWSLSPRLSPDGRWLAEHRSGFIRVTPMDEALEPALGGAEPSPDLRRARADRTTWIPASFGHAFDFVPGSDALVIVAGEERRRTGLRVDTDGLDHGQLWVVDLTPEPTKRRHRGGREVADTLPTVLEGRALRGRIRPIPGTERAMDPAVSPDGSRVAWLRYRDGTANLVVSGLDGSDPRVLTDFSDGTWLQGPSWSPDGRRIVLAVHRHHQQNLWTVDLDDGRLTPLTLDRHEALDPRWTDDGVLFAADLDGFYDIFRLDPDSGEVARLTRVLGGAASPSLTPAGHLLFASYSAHGWKTFGLPRDEWLIEPVLGSDGFRTRPDPALGQRDLAHRYEPGPLPSRRYAPIRALAAPSASPLLRIDGDPAGPRVMGGGTLRLHDVREVHTLSATALLGADRYAAAAWTWRAGRPTLRLWADHERARWPRSTDTGPSREIRRIERAGLTLRLPWSDRVSLYGEGVALIVSGGRLDRAGEVAVSPGLRSARLILGLDGGDLRRLAAPGAEGSAFDLSVVQGISGSPSTGSAHDWRQGRLHVAVVGAPSLGGPLRRHRVELSLSVAATDADLSAVEELRAGGDHPYALRLGALEPSRPFPGYAPWSLSGEALAIGTVGWRVPLGHRIARRLGPVHLDRLEARVAADLGDVWEWREGPGLPYQAHGHALLADVLAEVRAAAWLTDAPFDGFVRVAWPLVPPPPGPPRDAVVPDAAMRQVSPRLTLGIGTGW